MQVLNLMYTMCGVVGHRWWRNVGLAAPNLTELRLNNVYMRQLEWFCSAVLPESLKKLEVIEFRLSSFYKAVFAMHPVFVLRMMSKYEQVNFRPLKCVGFFSGFSITQPSHWIEPPGWAR